MKHSGNAPADCPLCRKAIDKMGPETPSAEFLTFAKAQRAKHISALRRQERDQALRDVGLTKVRSASGRVYWE